MSLRAKKAVTLFSLVLTLVLVAAGCSAPAPKQESAPGGKAPSAQQEVKRLSGPIAEQPALITSIGQSADAQMVKALATKAALKFEFSPLATEAQIPAGTKTLVAVIGGSSKGLGAAGIKAADELARAKALVAKAKAEKLKVVALHVGGEARRGALSDGFIKEIAPQADLLIVVEEGNKDGLFTQIAAKGIPLELVPNVSASLEPLKKAFK